MAKLEQAPGSEAEQGELVGVDLAASRLYVVMARLVRALRRAGTAEVAPGGMAALATLSSSGPMRLGDLAAREGVAPPTLTRIVAGLEEAGYVSRQIDPDDRRAVQVAVTPKGAGLVGGVLTARSAALRDRLLALSPGDRAALLACLPVLERLVAEDG